MCIRDRIQYRILVVSCVTGSSPRVWGRYIIALVCPPCQYGSSPRVWGRCPYPCSHTTSAIPVHPHACGADFYVSSFRIYPHRFIPTRVGQMIGLVCRWGRPQRFIPTRVGQIVGLRLDMHGNARFIPTRVGQMSWSEYGPFSSNTVHPHACGADYLNTAATTINTAVHPHACGADLTFVQPAQYQVPGSSPRVWGRYFPKCSYDWILINCKPSKSMIDRRGFPYVSMVKPCSLLVE